jgi:hypothetical protein
MDPLLLPLIRQITLDGFGPVVILELLGHSKLAPVNATGA